MKKILAVAVAAAFVAPLAASANPVLYGRINTQLVHTDPDGGDAEWDVEDNTSRLGVRGSEDLGNGLTAIYQFEFAVDSENTADIGDTGAGGCYAGYCASINDVSGAPGRLAYVGLSGGFGTVAIGRQWTPYYNTVDKTDIMQTNSMNDHYIGLTRVGNALAYVSPNFNGLTGTLALVISDELYIDVPSFGPGIGEDVGSDGIDWWNLSVDYANGPLSVGVSYLASNSGEINHLLAGPVELEDYEQWGIGAKYNFGPFALVGQYESIESDLFGDEETAWGLGGELYLGNNTIRGVYGNVDPDGGDSEYNWAVGAEHNFSKRTRVYAEYEDHEDSAQRFGIGIRHDF